MKKTIAIILVFCLCIGFARCASNSVEVTQPQETIVTEVQMEETTPVSSWEINEYVDDFGDPTGETYLSGVFNGTFSNSATTGSDLAVVVYTNAQSVFSFRLLEYGNNIANFNQYDDPILKTKINGEISEHKLIVYENLGDLYLVDPNKTFTSVLKDNTYKIACVIEWENSKYSFNFDGQGFAETFAEFKGEDLEADEPAKYVAVAIAGGDRHMLTLFSDGFVRKWAKSMTLAGDVTGWKTDFVAVAAGNEHSVGLKNDGAVLADGVNSDGRCDVSEWSGITAIAAGGYHTVGLKEDGTVVAVGNNDYNQCDVSEWSDIVKISASNIHTVGLKSDGTVVATGGTADVGQCNISGWTDIVDISAGGYHTLGLKADGTVVAVGYNENGQCDVSGWSNIVQVCAGTYHSVGLKSDGTVVAVGDNGYGQCEVKTWTNVAQITAFHTYTACLKAVKGDEILFAGEHDF